MIIRFLRVALISLQFLAFLVLLAIVLAVSNPAHAQALQFSASVLSSDGALDTTLTWDAPGASTCAAAGHSSWTGPKPAGGSEALPTITLSGTYQVSMSCTWQGDTTTTLTWTNATTNTDGTHLLDPKLIRLRWGESETSLSQVTDVPLVDGRLADRYVFTGVPPGRRVYAAYTVNQRDVESAASDLVVKVSTEAVTRTETVALTINPIPGRPVNLAVVEPAQQ